MASLILAQSKLKTRTKHLNTNTVHDEMLSKAFHTFSFCLPPTPPFSTSRISLRAVCVTSIRERFSRLQLTAGSACLMCAGYTGTEKNALKLTLMSGKIKQMVFSASEHNYKVLWPRTFGRLTCCRVIAAYRSVWVWMWVQ